MEFSTFTAMIEREVKDRVKETGLEYSLEISLQIEDKEKGYDYPALVFRLDCKEQYRKEMAAHSIHDPSPVGRIISYKIPANSWMDKFDFTPEILGEYPGMFLNYEAIENPILWKERDLAMRFAGMMDDQRWFEIVSTDSLRNISNTLLNHYRVAREGSPS